MQAGLELFIRLGFAGQDSVVMIIGNVGKLKKRLTVFVGRLEPDWRMPRV
jgi:hypothetical protein